MTMRGRILYFSLALLAASFAGTSYADPIEVGVTGSIKPTNACAPSLSNTAFTYGDIATTELSKDTPTVLAAKSLTLSVACAPQASKFYFEITDNTPAEWWILEPDLGNAAGATGGEIIIGMGLGMTGGKRPVGGVFLKLTEARADQNEKAIRWGTSTVGDDGDTSYSWTAMHSDFLRAGRPYTVADLSTNTPITAKDFAIKMDVVPVISPEAVDGLSADAKLNGSFTIEVMQL